MAAAAVLALLLAAAQPAPENLLPEIFRTAPERPVVAPAAPLPGVAPAQLPEEDTPGEVPPPGQAEGAASLPAARRNVLARDAQLDASRTGVLSADNGGWGDAVFLGSDGLYLAALARRIEAPIGSRWGAIALRRALISRAPAPARIAAGDWVAARAWLLLRMGDIDAANLLQASLPEAARTPAYARVAGQVALASAEPAALCPVARAGRRASSDTLWELAIGMCAALEGDDISAAAIFDGLRNRARGISPFDVRLGEQLLVLAAGSGRATSIDWREAPVLTPYRYGLATATGVSIPAERLAALGPGRHGWLVRQPMLAAEQRLAHLAGAAVGGSLSAREYASAVGALSTDDADTSVAALLRTAAAGPGPAQRVAAMKALWAKPDATGLDAADARYAGLVLTAPAALRLAPSATVAADADRLVASMLAVGAVRAAGQWWPVADSQGGAAAARTWALLAVAGAGVPVSPQRFRDWRRATGAGPREAARLLALLAGLGMAEGGDWNGLRDELLPAGETAWSRAIAAAGAARRPGEVMLLAAAGLQGAPADVPALHWWRLTQALVRAGHAREARLMAAEALARG